MVKVAVVLSGCGHMDGAEVREAVLALTALDKAGAEVSIYAPDINQRDVMNHLTRKPMGETRNVLVEAARIARGNVAPLTELKAEAFDALVIPGGMGVAKNLSDIAIKGAEATVLADMQRVLQAFADAEKPIGAICIAPALVTAALSPKRQSHVTLGAAENHKLIEGLGGVHQECATRGIVIDDANRIVSCSAYMRDDAKLSEIAASIEMLVEAVVARVKSGKKAA